MGDDQVYKILEQICQNNVRSYTFPDKIKNYLTVDKFLSSSIFLTLVLDICKETFLIVLEIFVSLSQFSQFILGIITL